MNKQLPTEEEGIKMIIALQAFAGIKETEEQARRGWAGMSDREKEQTARAYEFLGLGKEGEDV